MHSIKDVSYIELRLLLNIDCEEKYRNIAKILNFLNINGFITHLTMLYAENINIEDVFEYNDVMSLSIYMIDNKMRFKFWNGITTMWFSHTQDLFDELNMRRDKNALLYDKYEPITSILLDFKKKWTTFIQRISYQYHPDASIELTYNIVFLDDAHVDKILNKINKQISALDTNVIEDLSFDIQTSYVSSKCIPCEERRKHEKENDG